MELNAFGAVMIIVAVYYFIKTLIANSRNDDYNVYGSLQAAFFALALGAIFGASF